MDRRQRRTVNFFSRYVIDDQSVEKSNADEANSNAQVSCSDFSKVVSGEVTDGLGVKSSDLKKLYEELDFEKGSMDRLLCYEVTGIKLDGDDFASDSDDESASLSSNSQLLD